MKDSRFKMNAISLKTWNIVMSVMAGAVSLFMLYVAWISFSNFNVMLESTEKYIDSQRNAANLLAGSDYLTEQVLAFAVTDNKIHVERYFTEINQNHRRDNALKVLELNFSNSDAYLHLKKALDRSNALMNREFRSMRLVIEATGQDITQFPEVLQKFELDRRDQQLSKAEKHALARDILFGDEYSSVKGKIRSEVTKCIDLLIMETQKSQEASSGVLRKVMILLFSLICALLMLLFLYALITSLFVVKPLRMGAELMFSQQELPEDGPFELKYFARTYNRLFRQNKEHHKKLAYEAAHDPLTGLYNRSSFEKLRSTHEKRSIALLLVDVDKFKFINDNYGHDIGDRILKKVAYMLLSTFREEDYVFRIGGDEFAVIMVYANSGLKQTVGKKIRDCNKELLEPDDGLPQISLSVGVAFSDQLDGSGDLYKNADTALYEVKEKGRCGVAFFGDSH